MMIINVYWISGIIIMIRVDHQKSRKIFYYLNVIDWPLYIYNNNHSHYDEKEWISSVRYLMIYNDFNYLFWQAKIYMIVILIMSSNYISFSLNALFITIYTSSVLFLTRLVSSYFLDTTLSVFPFLTLIRKMAWEWQLMMKFINDYPTMILLIINYLLLSFDIRYIKLDQ